MKSLYLIICTAILLTQQCQSLKYDNEYDNNISTNNQLSDTDRMSDDNRSDNNISEQIISDKYLNNFIKRLLMKTSKSLINHQLINKLSNTTTSTLSLIKHNKRFTADVENKETRDPDRVTRNEDFLGSRGRRQHDSSDPVMIDHEKKFSNDFLGSRGKKYEEFLGSRGRRHDEEFFGSRGRRTYKNDDRDHSINRRINEEFLGSRGRRMDDFLGSRGKRFDEFYGSRGRRQSYLSSMDIDCPNTNSNYCDESKENNFLLNGYDNYLKQHLHQQLINDENSMTMLINKKSNKNNQQTRVDTQIVREPFWAHRGKKDNFHRSSHHVNNVWHNDLLFADEPYWVLVIDDHITTTRQTKNNNHLPSPFDNGPSSTDSTFTVLNNDNPFILSRG
ncbi:uncharacterized protein LOC123302567 [Chrysoperla carnea]|uniref:uncharacterized protein LOC123302567 n=1 Tax=Chrysoperla carnea TaxID=189513 RepID=UPI001D068284|nr:uncharacterized protein LOC123302567 [Chrysoperla carnea]